MKETDIKLPEPIHTRKIHEKLDLFAQDNLIRRWAGYDIIDTLFYLYLFNKYKNQCLLKSKGVTSTTALGLELQIKHRMTNDDKILNKKHLDDIAKQLANCIKNGQTSVIIPLYLKTTRGGHANILIYRKTGHVIEHFEPHGSYMEYTDQKLNDLIAKKLNEFIQILNNILIKDNRSPVHLVTSNIVCPTRVGLQNLESLATSKKLRLEGNGYCAAWSMFFSELALKNPTMSSSDLIRIIYDKLEKMDTTEKQSNYLRKIIIGYVNLIYEKIEKYFSFISGTKLTVESITELLKNRLRLDLFIKDYNTIIDIELQLLNNPSLTKEQYLNNLREQERNTSDSIELQRIRYQINTLEKMDTLLNPSPVSGKTKSAKSRSKSAKSRSKSSKSRSKSSSPLQLEEIIIDEEIEKPVEKITTLKKVDTPIDLESLSSVSSFLITPNCPEGKIFNYEKGRCVKIKKQKTKKISPKISPKIVKKVNPKAKTKKLKPCPEGEERNPETGRCKKIKVYPPCPPGQERDPDTHRCKKIKLKKK